NDPNVSSGLNVNLSVDRPGYFSFPNPVTIAGNQTQVQVTIAGLQPDPTPPVTLSATASNFTSGSTTQVSVKLLHIQMTPALLVNPGQASNLQIVLSDPAPAGGVTINLSSDHTNI